MIWFCPIEKKLSTATCIIYPQAARVLILTGKPVMTPDQYDRLTPTQPQSPSERLLGLV